MKKEKADIWIWIKRGTMLIIFFGGLYGLFTWSTAIFARESALQAQNKQQELVTQSLGKQLELTTDRQLLNISQDIVRDKKENMRFARQQVEHETRVAPPTSAERDLIREAKQELEEAKTKHNGRVEKFETKHKQNF